VLRMGNVGSEVGGCDWPCAATMVLAMDTFGSDVCGCDWPCVSGTRVLCPGAAKPVGERSG
jgi:hypothetical protein